MLAVYDGHGIRFEYPSTWELEETDDGAVTTVAVHNPAGVAFAIVTTDEERPEPVELAEQALAAMREEYPELDAVPAGEVIDGHDAVGHDIEFFSLDLTNGCAIRCYRTPRRTVLVFAQWSDIEDDDSPAALSAVRRSLEETDSD